MSDISSRPDNHQHPASPDSVQPEIILSKASPALKEHVPADLLQAFERNYYSRQLGRLLTYVITALLVIVFLAIAGWRLLSSESTQSKSSKTGVQSPAAASPPSSGKTAPSLTASPSSMVQKSVSAPRTHSIATPRKLPSFIPEKGRDKTYSLKKPGWERYLDPDHEFRIFQSGNRIKVVQVLSVKQHAISDVFLKSVLNELLAGSDYQVTSREQKGGFLILRGTVSNKGMIVIYTKKSRVLAFVLSLT